MGRYAWAMVVVGVIGFGALANSATEGQQASPAAGQQGQAPTQTPAPGQPQGQAPGQPVAGRSAAGGGNVEHGRYIAEHVAMCVECHSPRDAQGVILEDQKYMGAPIPVRPELTGWAIRAPRNRGLVGYTDEQAMRLLTQGAIGREGSQLLPPMPRFRMTPQDAADVIAFLRSLEAPGERGRVGR